jgi:hypothetical protein
MVADRRADRVSKVTEESEVCMREHAHIASRRRDERLALIRKLTLWVTGGAAAASLGLGAAFAHAVPGHAASTPGQAKQTSSATSHTASGGTGSTQPSQLTQPQQQPTQTTAPPVVTSGGS